MGYELAGTMTRHAVALDDLPRGPAGPLTVEEYVASRDLEDVRACYRASVSSHPGPIDSDEEDWWPSRVMGRWFSDDQHRAVVVRGASGVEGYASFTFGSDPGGPLEFEYAINCRHLVAVSLEAWASLLSYLRGFRGLGQTLRFTGPPAHPLALQVEEQRVRPVWSFRWMLRLLDVPSALAGRGYPLVSEELVLSVEDALFPENRGPWKVVADGSGSVSVSPAPASGRVRPISIGTLSAIYSGSLSAADAVTLGLVEPWAAPGLDRLFGGPAPWMYDFF
jgi:predicted acetyltransferase